MEWTQTSVGCALILLGLLAYFAAVDVISAIPGNVLFFVGVMTVTWGTTNLSAKIFFWLAAFSLLLLCAVVLGMLWRSTQGRSAGDGSGALK